MPEPRSKEQELAEHRTAHAPVRAGGEPAIWHVQEHDDHFVVTYTDGKSTSVPKEGLKKDTLAHIQGMAHGGEVRALAGGRVDPGGADGPDSGGRTAEEDLIARSEAALDEPAMKRPPGHPATTPTDEDLPPERRPEPTNFAQGGVVHAAHGWDGVPPMLAAPDPSAPAWDPAGWQDAALNPAPPPDSWLGPGQQVQDILRARGEGAVSPKSALPLNENGVAGAIARAPETAAGMATDALYNALPPQLRGGMTPPAAPQNGLAQDAQAGADATAAAMQGARGPTYPAAPGQSPSGLTGGSGSLTELNKGLAEQRQGLQMQVEAEKARDAAYVQLLDRQMAERQALEASGAQQIADHQRRADNLFQATLNNKIDPNRVWSSAGVGQKMAAGIGIILSGIGQGLAGGPNMALQVIDRTIDRDIDAQKNNLENQRNLLTHYLQQGRDMISAQQLVKADLKDMYAAQVQHVSAEFGGQDAAARAQLAGGQLRTEAASKRQEIIYKDLAMSQARLQMQQQQEMQRVLNAALHPTGGQAPMHPAMAALVMSGPEKMNEHAVQVPAFDGQGTTWRTRYAFNKEVVKDATNAFRKNQNIRGLVQELASIHAAHPLGSAVPGDVSKRAKIVANNLKLEWLGGEAGLNRLNERESEYLDQMIVNPADVFSTGQGGAIQELAHDVEQNQRNLEGSYLIPEGR